MPPKRPHPDSAQHKAPTTTMTASVSNGTTSPVPDTQVNALRAFNRFYTRRASILDPFLSGTLSLTDVRVLYELSHTPDAVATDIARTMGIDNGYLSRILKRFDAAGWIDRTPNPKDQRQSLLSLTAKGRDAYAPLNDKSHAEMAAMLGTLDAAGRETLLGAMNTIEALLSTEPKPPKQEPKVVLRDLGAGDLGWVLMQHGDVYRNEWGLNAAFEALVADVVAGLGKMDSSCERGWIVEIDGQRCGSVFVAKAPEQGVARIRLLLLGKEARGLGLGGRLVDECIAFARAKGYRKLELWTQSILAAANAIYTKRGFTKVGATPSSDYGRDVELVSYEMDLTK